MHTVPPALHDKVSLLAQPEAIEAAGFDASSLVGLTPQAQLLIYKKGGFLSSDRQITVALGDLTMAEEWGEVVLRGDALPRLAFKLDPDSIFKRVLAQVSAGEEPTWGVETGWQAVSLVTAEALKADPADARKPPGHSLIGKPRSTSLLCQRADGGLRVDDPHEVIEIPPEEIRAVEVDGINAVIHVVRPLLSGEVLVGIHLILPTAGALEPRGEVPRAVVAASVRGHLEGEPVTAAAIVRSGSQLEFLGVGGQAVGAMGAAELCWRGEQGMLLIRGQGESAVLPLPDEQAAWLMEGLPSSEEPLFEVIKGPVDPGAGLARVQDGLLHLATSSEAQVELGSLDHKTLRAESDPHGIVLHITPEIVLRGPDGAIDALRQAVGAEMGKESLAGLDLAELYRQWHDLRTDWWLWLVFGPIFVTQVMLEQASNLPPEEDEDEERLERRRLLSETLIAAEQVRSLRLRMGAAAVALPYALVDEEGDWLEAFAGEQAASALAKRRFRMIEGFRMQVRSVGAHMAFAQGDLERAVARLDPIHHPEMRGQQSNMLGRLGLGAATMLLSPISGTIQIFSAVAGKLTDQVGKDATARVYLDRFGPQCKSSWNLLVEVSAVAALEQRAWLRRLWADLAAADRALVEDLPEDVQEVMRRELAARIAALQARQQQPVSVEGAAIADIMAHVQAILDEGPHPLISYLEGGQGRQARQADEGAPELDMRDRIGNIIQLGRDKLSL